MLNTHILHFAYTQAIILEIALRLSKILGAPLNGWCVGRVYELRTWSHVTGKANLNSNRKYNLPNLGERKQGQTKQHTHNTTHKHTRARSLDRAI